MRTFFTRIIVFSFAVIGCLNHLVAQGVNQLWSTTPFGGTYGAGTIFSVDASGNNFRSRHSFVLQNPGFGQGAAKLAAWNGKFYGTTLYGSTNVWTSVIFEWDPATNVYTKKFDFNNSVGTQPGNLTLLNGKFYGSTLYGGTNSNGTLFEWDPATNVYTKKMDFPVNNGGSVSTLAVFNNKLYGFNGTGILFEWDPATNIYTEKLTVSQGGDLSLHNNKFYGLMPGGGLGAGSIFEWDPLTNILTEKFSFPVSGASGIHPGGSLTFYGTKFYGITSEGGANNVGVIFQWDPATNVFAKRFDLNTTSGVKPFSELVLNAAKFYGITSEGGANNGGTIFEWDPATNIFIKKIDMVPATGSHSLGGLLASGGKVYGMTDHGGSEYNGVLFEYDPSSNTYSKKIDLNANKGMYPAANLAFKNGKFFGITADGSGSKGKGVLFEWNTADRQLTKRLDFGAINGSVPSPVSDSNSLYGSYPSSTPIEKDGKYYGITSNGGANDDGVLFEWDPATNTYTKKIDLLTAHTGASPLIESNKIAGLVLNNDRFYGTNPVHGDSMLGELFEWIPATNTYTKRLDFTEPAGAYPNAPLALYNDKYYGTTIVGGANQSGVLFEWDPATNIYTPKINFAIGNNGYQPKAGLVVLNGKLYGSTYKGGTNDLGVLFEWDPSTNTYTKKIDCNAGTGSRPQATLTVSEQKLYGIAAEGGANNKGVVFEWDPVANTYSVKHHFTGADGENSFIDGAIVYNGFSLVPAPVAAGTPGACASYAPLVIDNSNNNIWVPLVDNNGDVVAELKANGNNLGTFNYSIYVHNGPVREDGSHRLYLDRNITITPQTQPSTPVDIRLYITEAEFQALKNATNSQGQPSGVNTINDIGLFKNGSNSCNATIQASATMLSATAQVYNNGYVLTAGIPSFSSFYLAKNTSGTLPLRFLEFNARLLRNDAVLNWVTSNENNTSHFDVERSDNGRSFVVVGKVNGSGNVAGYSYSYKDAGISSLPAPIIYYRLKQVGQDGKEQYSAIISLSMRTNDRTFITINPNPVKNDLNLIVNSSIAGNIIWSINDNNGRTLRKGNRNLSQGNTSLVVDIASLAPGIYYLKVQGNTMNERVRFLKQ